MEDFNLIMELDREEGQRIMKTWNALRQKNVKDLCKKFKEQLYEMKADADRLYEMLLKKQAECKKRGSVIEWSDNKHNADTFQDTIRSSDDNSTSLRSDIEEDDITMIHSSQVEANIQTQHNTQKSSEEDFVFHLPRRAAPESARCNVLSPDSIMIIEDPVKIIEVSSDESQDDTLAVHVKPLDDQVGKSDDSEIFGPKTSKSKETSVGKGQVTRYTKAIRLENRKAPTVTSQVEGNRESSGSENGPLVASQSNESATLVSPISSNKNETFIRNKKSLGAGTKGKIFGSFGKSQSKGNTERPRQENSKSSVVKSPLEVIHESTSAEIDRNPSEMNRPEKLPEALKNIWDDSQMHLPKRSKGKETSVGKDQVRRYQKPLRLENSKTATVTRQVEDNRESSGSENGPLAASQSNESQILVSPISSIRNENETFKENKKSLNPLGAGSPSKENTEPPRLENSKASSVVKSQLEIIRESTSPESDGNPFEMNRPEKLHEKRKNIGDVSEFHMRKRSKSKQTSLGNIQSQGTYQKSVEKHQIISSKTSAGKNQVELESAMPEHNFNPLHEIQNISRDASQSDDSEILVSKRSKSNETSVGKSQVRTRESCKSAAVKSQVEDDRESPCSENRPFVDGSSNSESEIFVPPIASIRGNNEAFMGHKTSLDPLGAGSKEKSMGKCESNRNTKPIRLEHSQASAVKSYLEDNSESPDSENYINPLDASQSDESEIFVPAAHSLFGNIKSLDALGHRINEGLSGNPDSTTTS